MFYYLSLGSNINAFQNVSGALMQLRHRYRIKWASQPVETKPVNMPEGTPDFVNQIVVIETNSGYNTVKEETKQIERIMGRTGGPKDNRAIDIDIIAVDSMFDIDFFYFSGESYVLQCVN